MSTDLDKLQGSWKITALEVDERELPASTIENSRITISGNQFESVAMGVSYKGQIELNQNQKPKIFDLVFTEGPEQGNRNPGIYELEGDTWTICLATRGNQRPKKFATVNGSGIALETLRRENNKARSTKPKSETRRSAGKAEVTPAGPPTELEGEWQMVSGVFNGLAMDQLAVKWCRRITRGNLTKVTAGPQIFLNASFTLNADAQPNAIDYLNLDNPNKGKSQAGIFELKNDLLSICMAAPGQPRPQEFSSKEGDERSYTTWRLIKK
jgi:uncharacterized protein (TIGR03067 family)